MHFLSLLEVNGLNKLKPFFIGIYLETYLCLLYGNSFLSHTSKGSQFLLILNTISTFFSLVWSIALSSKWKQFVLAKNKKIGEKILYLKL
jgi:hypothetical protein